MNRLGRTLKWLREQKGLSQRALAGQVGVSWTTICKFERGQLVPGPETLERLAELLEGNRTELLLLAGKVPETIREQLERCPAALRFLEKTAQFRNEEWERLYRFMWGK